MPEKLGILLEAHFYDERLVYPFPRSQSVTVPDNRKVTMA